MVKHQQNIDTTKSESYIWVTSFLILCLSFSPLTFNFIWGNHDWLPLIQDSRLTSGLIEGRFSQYLLLKLLLMGKILPILNLVIGFMLYSIALYCLSRYYFNYKTNKLPSALFISTAVSMPHITEIVYFHFITLSLLSWTLVIALSLIAMQKAAEVLDNFGVAYEKKVVSAHRTPDLMFKHAEEARSRGIKVIIAGAGGAAHLPGMVAAKTTLPVIGVPVKSRALSGVDSLYSIVQMPGGVPVATMAIGEAGATNAALFALRLLSVEDKAIADALANFAEEQGKIAEESTNELN